MAAYAKAAGISEYWLGRVLDSSTRVRLSTIGHFVRNRLVSAEWLFCGTGPMLPVDVHTDDIEGAFVPMTISSKYPIFDPASVVPVLPNSSCQSFVFPGSSFSGAVSTATVPAARQVFISRQNQKPVVMHVSASVIASGVTPIIIDMLRKQYVTGISMSTSAAWLDYTQAGSFDVFEFQKAIVRGATAGLGLGEALGLFIDKRENSLLAAAYDLNAPVTVHGAIGETAIGYQPFKSTAEFGAAFGTASYIDSLVFAAQIEQLAGDVMSAFIYTGSPIAALAPLSVAMRNFQLTKKLKFNRLKLIRLSAQNVESSADVCICAPYRELFPALLVSCDAIYEGGFDVFTNKNTGEQFAAFGFIKQCVENVRKKPKARPKR